MADSEIQSSITVPAPVAVAIPVEGVVAEKLEESVFLQSSVKGPTRDSERAGGLLLVIAIEAKGPVDQLPLRLS